MNTKIFTQSLTSKSLLNCIVTLLAGCLLSSLSSSAWAKSPIREPQSETVSGVIKGLNGVQATVTIGHDGYLRSVKTDSAGSFEFKKVPYGKYFLKAESNGYALGQAQSVTVPERAAGSGTARAPSRAPARVTFQAVALPNDRFSYHWNEDASRSGYETTAGILKPPVITFLNESITPADPSSASILQYDYNITLANDQVTWTQEYASRLLSMMKIIPQFVHYSATNGTLKPSKWILTDKPIADDISITRADGGDTVTLSTAAMVYAIPKMVTIDGVKGNFFSKRLHHALVRYVTSDGSDIQAVEKILRERFGTSILVPDYSALTATTTQEDAARYTQFRPRELISILTMFEEMPDGMHVIKNLKYLVRRNFGQANPKFFCVAALAFTQAGYIEFVDGAFTDLSFTHHVILHEKSHFMWDFLLNDKIKDAWATVGGWTRDSADRDGWTTTQTTTFVSSYAHKKNPNEDMAESIAAFVLDPNLLKSRALAKFEFIRDNIMHGGSFVSVIRDDLTFEVLNLFPDYDYPGKIKRIDVTVDGAPESDKLVTIELELNTVEGKFDSASTAYMILRSEIGTYKELWFHPKSGPVSNILVGTLDISKYAKGGFWSTDQIRVIDAVGNTRYEGVHDFGWKMFVNNPLEDVSPPRYVPHSLAMQLMPATVIEGHMVQKLNVTWQVDKNGPINALNDMNAQLLEKNSKTQYAAYGYYDSITKTARVEFDITEFYASGQYEVESILLKDAAGNRVTQFFSDSPKDERAVSIAVQTANPDYQAPDLDLAKITIDGTPTNPTAPNGETRVHIVFYARDDKAGIRNAYYTLLDPQGISHNFYYAHASWQTLFFQGDPTPWTRYEINELLPVGSAPGKWGLAQIELVDQARNSKAYSFVEVLHFEIMP